MLDAIRSFFSSRIDTDDRDAAGEPGDAAENAPGDPAGAGAGAGTPEEDEAGPGGPEAGSEGPLPERRARLAACALLLELAWADDEFSASEREHLEGTVRRQFGLDEDETSELLELAHREQERAVDLFQFTRLIERHFTLGQKMVLAEAMWGLVYADGTLASREGYLIRKISNLLHLEPGYLAEARERVEGGGADEA